MFVVSSSRGVPVCCVIGTYIALAVECIKYIVCVCVCMCSK